MSRFQRLIIVAAALLAGQSALSAEAVGTAPNAAPNPLVQIELGDQIRVEVFGSPELTTITDVTDEGTIRMPLVGPIQVKGKSLAEAARRIEAALKEGQILVDPHATVSIATPFRLFVTVMGEVGTQGRIPIQANTTVLDVIALAGGISDKGSNTIYILRKNAAGTLQRLPVKLDMQDIVAAGSISLSAMQVVQGDDSIIVPKGTFTIIGQVTQPGEYRIESGMMLFQALAKAGGVTQLGSASRVQIRRRGADDKFVDLKGKKDMLIEPGDVITVKERLF